MKPVVAAELAPPSPDTYLNRELAQLAFNRRVLELAEDPETPLLERLRYVCIVSSNLDEFFEVRVAGLKEQIRYAGVVGEALDEASPRQVLIAVSEEAHRLVEHQYKVLNNALLPALKEHDVRFLRRTHWNEEQAKWVKTYFFEEVMPVLSPIGLDPAHPFPRVLNKSLNFAVELDGKDAFGRTSGTAIVQAPRILPRVIAMPAAIAGCEHGFVFLSSVLHAHVGELFAGMRVRGCYQFRVTRNSDLFVDEEEVTNLKLALQGELSHRQYGDAVRLEVADNCSPEMADFLLGQFNLAAEDLYQVNGPVNLVRLIQVPDRVDLPALKFPCFVPSVPAALTQAPDIFTAIRAGDILLHHPFESFNPVIEFLRQAAADPDVLAIKQTVYRTGKDSVLMQALVDAAKNGKEVTVVVELMARFDEEANLNWAAQLEEAGAHVVYGVFGYKTHAKMALVVRRENNALQRYVHLSTGNYHPGTAKRYTDFGLLTCNEGICNDAADGFMQLTGLGKPGRHTHFWQAPFNMHKQLVKAIRDEADIARAGGRAMIVAKMNSLLEPGVITELYHASQAGVKIELIVRGICALRPGVAGLSDNIRVRSVIGRFLEHTRLFYFHHRGEKHLYLSSADWMHRNFFRRIEIAFPVLDKALKRRILKEGLDVYRQDNVFAWEMDGDGHYRRRNPRKARRFSAQQYLLETHAQSLAVDPPA